MKNRLRYILLVIKVLFFSFIGIYLSVTFSNFFSVKSSEKNNNKLKIKILDLAGSGDCVIIICNDIQIMIDTGESDEGFEIIKSEINSVLEDDNDKKWDYCIFTHPDDDHIGNAVKVMEYLKENNWSIGTVIDYDFKDRPNKIFSSDKSLKEKDTADTYRDYIKKCFDKSEIDYFSAADNLSETNLVKEYKINSFLSLKILYNSEDNYESFQKRKVKNDISVCCIIEYYDKKMLFTGDLQVHGEKELIDKHRELITGVTFYKAAHHGSNSSNCEEFIDIIRPNYVACSYNGKANGIDYVINYFLKYTDYIYPTYVANPKGEAASLFGTTEFVFSRDSVEVNSLLNPGSGNYNMSIKDAIIEKYAISWFNEVVEDKESPACDSFYVYTFDEGLPEYNNCTLIKYGHFDILLDCGSTNIDSEVFVDKLKELVVDGIIEYVIVTHYHPSCYSQLIETKSNDIVHPGVFNSFVVENVIDSSISYAYNDILFDDYLLGISKANNHISVKPGEELALNITRDVSAKIIGNKGNSMDENDKCLIVILQYIDKKMLFVGDTFDYEWLVGLKSKNILSNVDFLRFSNATIKLEDMNKISEFMQLTEPNNIVFGSPIGYLSQRGKYFFDNNDQLYFFDTLYKDKKGKMKPSRVFVCSEIEYKGDVPSYININGDLVYVVEYKNGLCEADVYSRYNYRRKMLELVYWDLE